MVPWEMALPPPQNWDPYLWGTVTSRLCWSPWSSAGLHEPGTQTSEESNAQLALLPQGLTGRSLQNWQSWDPDLWRWSPGQLIVVFLRDLNEAGSGSVGKKSWELEPAVATGSSSCHCQGGRAAAGLRLTGTVGKEEAACPFLPPPGFQSPFYFLLT